MLKTEIKYGIITGAGICIWLLIEFFLGFHTEKMYIGEYTTYFVVLIPLLTLYMGIKEKRDRINNGQISIGSGIKTGLMISLIATVIIALFLIAYFNYINPNYAEFGVAYQRQKLILSGKSTDEIAGELESIKNMFRFINQLLFGTLGVVGTGFIISIALSLFLKKNPGKNISI